MNDAIKHDMIPLPISMAKKMRKKKIYMYVFCLVFFRHRCVSAEWKVAQVQPMLRAKEKQERTKLLLLLLFFFLLFGCSVLKSLFLVTKHILGTSDECHIHFAHQIIDNFAFNGVFIPDAVFAFYFAIILSVRIVTSLRGGQSSKHTKRGEKKKPNKQTNKCLHEHFRLVTTTVNAVFLTTFL